MCGALACAGYDRLMKLGRAALTALRLLGRLDLVVDRGELAAGDASRSTGLAGISLSGPIRPTALIPANGSHLVVGRSVVAVVLGSMPP